MSSCARQYRKPGTVPSTSRVPLVRIALSEKLNNGALRFSGNFILESEEASYLLNETHGKFQVKFANQRLVVRSKKREFIYQRFQRLDFVPQADSCRFYWNGSPYRGTISFVREGQKLLVVNTLPLPLYLEGVIPSEIPSHNPEYYPAILAQTVVARTYTMYHLLHPASAHFDLYQDVRHQVYAGAGNNAPLAQKAIAETRGLILRNARKEVVETQYHSTCGDRVEKQPAYFAQLNPDYLEDRSDHSYNCAISPYYRWVRKINTRTILKNLTRLGKIPSSEAQTLAENGYHLHISVVSRHASGRIEQVAVRVNHREISLNQWEVRRAFAPASEEYLPSSTFFFKSSRQDSSLVYLIGAGFGHGKGMCQWGAIGQALRKKNYRDILHFYFPELQIEKAY